MGEQKEERKKESRKVLLLTAQSRSPLNVMRLRTLSTMLPAAHNVFVCAESRAVPTSYIFGSFLCAHLWRVVSDVLLRVLLCWRPFSCFFFINMHEYLAQRILLQIAAHTS